MSGSDFPSVSVLMADLAAEAQTPTPVAEVETPVADTPVQETVTEEVVEQPVAETTQVADQATAEGQPTIEQLFEVKADGKVEKVDLEEMKRRASAGTHLTRKSMELADQKRQLDAWQVAENQRIATENQRLAVDRQRIANAEAAWNDANALAERYNALVGQQTQQVQQPAAQQQVAQITPQQIAAFVQEQTQATLFQRDLEHFHNNAEQQIQLSVDTAITANPLLADIEDIGVLLRRDVAKIVEHNRKVEGRPTELTEVKTLLETAAKARATRLEKKIGDERQAAIMRHAKVTKPGIAPKGGAAPAVQAPTKIKWGTGDMAKSIEAELRAEATR